MDIARQVASYIQTAGFGTVGTDIFVGQMPASKDGVFVVRTSGTFNNYLPIESTIVDIFVKDSSSQQAVTKIEGIKRYLHRLHNTSTPTAYIYSILAISDVETIERTDDYMKLYKISLEVTHRALSVIS